MPNQACEQSVCYMGSAMRGHRTSHRLMREAFRQDTLKAWEEYRTTGLHVTADEADAWLAQLEQGNDIAPSECHV